MSNPRYGSYESKDISIVIVTYNRAHELDKNLNHLRKLKSKPREIIIVDQSETNLTKKVYLKYRKSLNLVYLRSEKPSIAIAKNIGKRKVSNKSKIVLFLDDDAYVEPTYLDEVVAAYNRNPDAVGVNGEEKIYQKKFFKKVEKNKFTKLARYLEIAYRRFFLLSFRGDKSWRITSPHGNTCTMEITGDVPAQWFSGTNPSYKKFVFDKMDFDENFIGWSLGEDVDISYRIHKRFGHLYVVPSSLFHENPKREDTPERRIKRIYMNQINHFYLFFKDMPEMKLRFIWNLVGIFLYKFLSLFNPFSIRKGFFEFKHFINALFYSVTNMKRIKNGDLRIPYG
jgi:GT2 family glycosyltransferase